IAAVRAADRMARRQLGGQRLSEERVRRAAQVIDHGRAEAVTVDGEEADVAARRVDCRGDAHPFRAAAATRRAEADDGDAHARRSARGGGPGPPRRCASRTPRVAAVPVFLPCHSAISNARLTSDNGKLCETTLDSGYLSFVRTRKSSALGMIHGS